MNLRSCSRNQSCLKDNKNILSVRSGNIPSSMNSQILDQKKSTKSCKVNLRKKNIKSDSKYVSDKNISCSSQITDKENIVATKKSTRLGLKNEKNKCKSILKDKKHDVSQKEIILSAENINKGNNCGKENKTNKENNKKCKQSNLISTEFDYAPNIAVISNEENSHVHYCPIWKRCLNESKQSCSKRRKISDVYDITKDEDLKKEESSVKFKKKSRQKQKCEAKNKKVFKLKKTETIQSSCLKPNTVKKNISLLSTTGESSKNLVLQQNQSNNIKTNQLCLSDISENQTEFSTVVLTDKKSSSKVPKMQLKANELNSIDPVEKKTQFFAAVSTDKNRRRKVDLKNSKMLSTSAIVSESNVNLNFENKQRESVPLLDVSKRVIREATPVREIGLQCKELTNKDLEKTMDYYTDDERLLLIPQMTSTPEADCGGCDVVFIRPEKNFAARLSEIPAIPKICNNLVDFPTAEDELINCEEGLSLELKLFESPGKNDQEIDKSHHCKQLKIDSFLKNDCSLHVYGDLNQFNLFESPRKAKDKSCAKNDADELSKVKIKKPKKSYDDRNEMRRNITKWKKTEGTKKKIAVGQKEDELVKSLNEHFSELENFELCID